MHNRSTIIYTNKPNRQFPLDDRVWRMYSDQIPDSSFGSETDFRVIMRKNEKGYQQFFADKFQTESNIVNNYHNESINSNQKSQKIALLEQDFIKDYVEFDWDSLQVFDFRII